MTVIRRILVTLPLLLLGLAPIAAVAQEKPVTIESSTMQPSVLLSRPMLTWWDVKVRVPGLMVGQLRFDIKFENILLATFETEEFSFTSPGQRIRVMLPAIEPKQPYDRLDVDIYFQGKKFNGLASQQILRIPFATKKVFVGLVSQSKTVNTRSAERDKLLDRLRFENIIPKSTNRGNEDADRDLVKTLFASIDPADFPIDPLSYCGYDLTVLFGDEFHRLRTPQLDAILAWVKAGGALYLEPGGVLEPYHVDFLKGLIANDPQRMVIELDSNGKLLSDTVPLDRPAAVVKCGLGHVVLRTEDPGQELKASAEEWLTFVGPLWNARQQYQPAPPLSYQINGQDGRPVVASRPNPDPWGLLPMNLNRFQLQQSLLLDRLMPEGVRMVPVSVLAAILFAFVLIIGPGDYFILGWLRIRKLTWVTFPAATLAVTALTVWVSNSYMSSGELTHAAEIRDLGPTGEVVRTNRFELLFYSSRRRVTTNVEKGLFAALNTAGDPMFASYRAPGQPMPPMTVTLQNGQTVMLSPNSNRYISRDGQVVEVPPQVQGRIPARFSVAQDLGKWTPKLNRLFAIPGTATRPPVNWDNFQLHSKDLHNLEGHQVPTGILNAAHKQFGPQVMVACFHGRSDWAYDRAPAWRSGRRPQSDQAVINSYQDPTLYQQLQSLYGIRFNEAPGEADLFRWIYESSVTMPEPGIFSLTKQTTPKGGAVCDDLLLLDTSDPKAWLLVIVVPEKNDYVVYRKLMRVAD